MTSRTGRSLGNLGAFMTAAAGALALASCGPKQPKLETIIVPLPENLPAIPETPALPQVPIPPELVTASKGEDLWHLRSALNVAALICDAKVYTALVPGYNRLLTTHKALLTAAVQTELDQFKAVDKRKWQSLYDTHMTKLYNQYSLTQNRPAFCLEASATAGDAADMTDADLSMQATRMIFMLNRAADGV